MTTEQATNELYTELVKRYPESSVRTTRDLFYNKVCYEDPVSGYEFHVRIMKLKYVNSLSGEECVRLLAYRPDEQNAYASSWFPLSNDGIKKCLRLLSFHRTLAVKTAANKHDRLAAELQADLGESAVRLVR